MIHRIFFIIIFATLKVYQINATDLKLGLSGEKNFVLNSNVGSNELKFISNAPLEDISGKVDPKTITSSFKMNLSNLEETIGEVRFKVEGMQTGISRRDKHLQSSDWLDAKNYPEIIFKLNNLEKVSILSNEFSLGRTVLSANARGVFSIHGKTKEFTIPIKLTYLKESEATRKRASGDLVFVEGNFELALKDFDVKGASGIIGSKVGEVIKINFQLFYSSK